ncbi:MAG: imelysin family protein [Chitinophagales bacterium]
MKNILYFLFGLVLVFACKPNSNSKNYETAEMLKNVAENIVLPNYTALETNTNTLNNTVQDLRFSPDAANLVAAQNAFLEAYKSWQKVSAFQFGPAADVALNTINIFPTDTTQIQSNIAASTYNLDAASNIDASGFPALDYLLFSGTEFEILNRFSTAADSEYALAVSEQIKNKVSQVKNLWETSYKTTFLAATGNAVGSSLSELTNAMILNFEKNAREAKIGIPAGVRTLNQIVPDKVEAFYSKNSILLAKEHIAGFKELYEGKNGDSFKAILIAVDKETLANNMSSHISNIETSLNLLSDPFNEMLENDNTAALATYAEYQKLLPLLKVDMTAALGLLITYSDSDGD